jgi:hypothetical protein
LSLKNQDGQSVVWLLALTIADFKGIADALDMTEPELAAVWSSLPLQDPAIGQILGSTTVQVSNIRLAARALLTRRLAKEGYSF